MIREGLKIFQDAFKNFWLQSTTDVFYVIETVPWSIYWDGVYITKNLKAHDLSAHTTTTTLGLRKKIIHFGSINTLAPGTTLKRFHPSNQAILTWFHVSPDDARLALVPQLNHWVSRVHTSCNGTKEKLIAAGLSPEKVVVIPLGVDLKLFQPCTTQEQRRLLRQRLGLPESALIIGSFQKDGEGWGEGRKPKLIKGPDIFCEGVVRLKQSFPNLHVLLTGPARGYVKQRLQAAHIPFTHILVDTYEAMPDYYRALDLYLMTSREEGGPKAILESLACGVPCLATRTGIAPDLYSSQLSFLLVEQEAVETLVERASLLLRDQNFYANTVQQGIEEVQNYTWEKITERYFRELYVPLIQQKS